MKNVVIGGIIVFNIICLVFFCYSMDIDLSSVMPTEINKPHKKAESKYFFHQQVNDMCMIAPMLNLKILEQMKNEDGTYNVSNVGSYTRREWMALNIPYLLKWHGIIESLNHLLGKQQHPNLIQFIEKAKTYGPVFPHFYDINGKLLLSSNISEVFSGTLQAPYFLIDFNAVKCFQLTIFGWPFFSMGDLGPSLGLFLPIFKYKNGTMFHMPAVMGKYPHETVFFEPFQLLYTENNTPDLSQFNDTYYREMTNLTNLSVVDANFLGFDKVLKTTGIARGYLSKDNQSKESEFVTFSLGLYKLMLLTLGIIDHPKTYIDKFSSNEEELLVKEQEEDLERIISATVKDIHDIVEQDLKNPWNSTYFSKEKLLQYAIAQVLREDPDLYEKAKVVSDFYFSVWGTYDKYLHVMAEGECYNAAHQRYYANLVKYFLPSEEYVMAYALTQSAWYLAIGAINNDAFYKALTNDTGLVRGLFTGVFWQSFKNKAYEKKYISGTKKSLSYIDVWKEITKKLFEKYKGKNWISFSGHGLVISFDDELIKKQKDMHNADSALFNDLGFTIIDSWLGTELNTFYKK